MGESSLFRSTIIRMYCPRNRLQHHKTSFSEQRHPFVYSPFATTFLSQAHEPAQTEKSNHFLKCLWTQPPRQVMSDLGVIEHLLYTK